MKAEDRYALPEDIFFFGDDGVGNVHGWSPQRRDYVRWNPEEGGVFFERHQTIDALFAAIRTGLDEDD